MSAVRERLKLIYQSSVTNKFKQPDKLSRNIKTEVSTQKIHKSKYNLNLFYTIMLLWYVVSLFKLSSEFHIWGIIGNATH
jgi:hypothetical protein